MTFEEHLELARHGDEYDWKLAETTRAQEIFDSTAWDDAAHQRVCRAQALKERRAYESLQRETLQKNFEQQASFPGFLDETVHVKLGKNVSVPFGHMNLERIRMRIDLRTDGHIDEARSFETEIVCWRAWETRLSVGTAGMEVLDYLKAQPTDPPPPPPRRRRRSPPPNSEPNPESKAES